MLGREDRIGFSMFSRKLVDLSIDGAVWDPRFPEVNNGLLGLLLDERSNLPDDAIAPVCMHYLCCKPCQHSCA